MQYRKFGTTDLTVSEVGFGAWAIGGGAMIGNTAIGWGDADDKTSNEAIKAALEAGVTFFDTADIYGLGHSEEMLGEALNGIKNVVIATKVGNVSRNEQFTVDYSKEYILNACEKSLKRLQRDVIDYYQLHTARVQHLQNGACIEAMQQLQKEGKIRHWGISLNTFAPEAEADFFMENGIGSGFQLVLNIINQKALPLVKKAAANGYGVIARMPLQFGLLTGKFNTETTFDENDHRRNRLTPDVIEATNTALQPVWQLCEKYGINQTQLAISYVLSYDEISTVIPGIRTPQHVSSNTQGLVKLNAEDMRLMENLGSTSFAQLMQLIQEKG